MRNEEHRHSERARSMNRSVDNPIHCYYSTARNDILHRTSHKFSFLRLKSNEYPMISLLRLAILNWWKRRCTFYINVEEQKDEVSLNPEYRIGVLKLCADGSDYIEDCSFNVSSEETGSDDCSSSAASSSHFDITLTSSSQEGRQKILVPNCPSDDEIMNCRWVPPPQRLRQQFSTDDIILTRPFPLTPCRSFSTSSVVSIDSLNTSSCWNSGDETCGNVATDFGIYAQEPFRFLSSSTSTTDDTQTNSDSDFYQYFFIQHMIFLRNQTRPRLFRQHTSTSRHTRNPDVTKL